MGDVEPVTAGASPGSDPRRLIRRSSLAGVAVGVVAATVVLALTDDDPGDDADEPPVATVLGGTEPQLTTPPTLTPLDSLPSTRNPDAFTDMNGTTSQDRVLFDRFAAITVPEYPSIDDAPDDDLTGFDLEAAVRGLAVDASRRASTRYEVGSGAFRLDVIVSRDAGLDRYELVVDRSTGESSRLVVDVAGGTAYATASRSDEWVAIANDDLVAPDGATIADQLDRLLAGPVRLDTLADAVLVTGGPLVSIDGGPPTRRHSVTLRAGVVPEWARYQLGPVADAPPPDPSDPIAFFAYVDETGVLTEVTGTFPFGNTAQLVVHRLEELPADTEITLPDRVAAADTGSDPPVVPAPGSAP